MVTWNDIDRALEGSSKMYKLLQAKQGSGNCTAGRRLRQWDASSD